MKVHGKQHRNQDRACSQATLRHHVHVRLQYSIKVRSGEAAKTHRQDYKSSSTAEKQRSSCTFQSVYFYVAWFKRQGKLLPLNQLVRQWNWK